GKRFRIFLFGGWVCPCNGSKTPRLHWEKPGRRENQSCLISAPRRLEADVFGWRPNRTPIKRLRILSIRISFRSPSTLNRRLHNFTALMCCGRRLSCLWTALESNAFAWRDIFHARSLPLTWTSPSDALLLCTKIGPKPRTATTKSFISV